MLCHEFWMYILYRRSHILCNYKHDLLLLGEGAAFGKRFGEAFVPVNVYQSLLIRFFTMPIAPTNDLHDERRAIVLTPAEQKPRLSTTVCLFA